MPQQRNPTEAPYTVTEARAAISQHLANPIPRSTFYRLIATGQIEAQRVGGKLLVTPEEIRSFLTRALSGQRW